MKPHILIVEDDPDIAESIRYNLEREGAFTAHVVLTGEEGLKAALNPHVGRRADGMGQAANLIILDLNLPGMNGFEFCRRLRTEEATRRLPIIILTAPTEESDKVPGLELGADDYITKPFSVRELVALGETIAVDDVEMFAVRSGGMVFPVMPADELEGLSR